MSDSNSSLLKFITGISTLGGLLGLIYLFILAGNEGDNIPTQICIDRKLKQENEAYNQLKFTLVGPSAAPEPIQELTKLGFQIMLETKKYAHEYVGNKLSCTNCHFAGGITTGMAQGGISLAGVATKYPTFDNVAGKVIDLPYRINGCFLRSMNGKALPLDSELMLALITYFQWISRNLPIYREVPWLGLTPLSSQHIGNADNGEKIYEVYCSICHREDYRGEIYPPPLWGDGAFNDRAGMNIPSKLATFVYWNMPYTDKTPVLSEEQALDVAAYIITKPRPHYNPPSS